MTKNLYLIIILSLLTNAGFAKFKDTVVAKVNDIKIYKSEFLTTYNQNLLYVSNKKVTPNKVINDLINKKLGIQNAKKEKLQNNPIVKEKMETVLYHAKLSKDIAPLLKTIKVKNQDLLDYYRTFPEIRTAQILFRMKAKPEKLENKAALDQANKVYQILKKSPDKFAQMANKYSQSQASQIGGDVGFQPAVKYAPEYFEAINHKKAGFISKPIRTQFGYQIVKVLGVKTFKEINKPLYKKLVYDQKRDKILADYHKKMRSRSKIWIDRKFIK